LSFSFCLALSVFLVCIHTTHADIFQADNRASRFRTTLIVNLRGARLNLCQGICLLLLKSTVLVEKLIFPQVVKKLPVYCGTEGSLLCPQHSATDPYPEPD
jgi:hypothetical protein